MTQDIRFAYGNRLLLGSARKRLAEAAQLLQQTQLSAEAKAVIATLIDCADDAMADCLDHGDRVVREMIPVRARGKGAACIR
ncbi:hypothetical protein [Magnetospirillum moscoviense]|uniref:Uncharacterized protein n=1 Tax=Magnetospirillum moscoviense TaxID=1437059 RepID=A0A178MM23_9PROT|nr:hypothetical protein [Magnetospirillum moscoviense]MBF0325599.1 hypothetical protein [Alphaproteobacteria bacterium]OAN48974.1 hypothetical protein A6A05_03030 [Magnetospirillum moscoviense]